VVRGDDAGCWAIQKQAAARKIKKNEWLMRSLLVQADDIYDRNEGRQLQSWGCVAGCWEEGWKGEQSGSELELLPRKW